ncbi:MAG: AAA family ATPase [Planctomycetes bacterium]|nr:AAA family ATPase [Planctomycetota bacterium]
MLRYLRLKNVGPAPEMAMHLEQRLNLITGDNGLGKSFLLDIAWWALTRRWPAEVNPRLTAGMRPLPPRPGKASIAFSFTGQVTTDNSYESTFDRSLQSWSGRPGRPANPGLVLYAQVDGSFAVWDPARNYWKTRGKRDVQDRPPAYVFSPKEVWDGLSDSKGTLCNGLIRDWASWQGENGHPFQLLKAALKVMSPSRTDPLVPGDLTRISLDDVRDMPTLRMSYGTQVPIVHASAGMRRMAALTYLLVWAWEEHQRASKLLDQQPTMQVTFLIDEVETHLHPRWQRLVLGSLLKVVEELMTGGNAQVQVLAATHSPLVLASVEPLFDEGQDALWHLDTQHDEVTLTQTPWAKQGDILAWLVSDTFGLRQARSAEAEEAILAAEAFMRHELSALPDGLRTQSNIHARLLELLPGHDPFWPRWVVETDQLPGRPTRARPRR